MLSDEAYRWLDLQGSTPLAPPMRNLGPRAISAGTFSKPFGLPGLRIGWIAAPEDVVRRCWGLRDYISLSPGKLNDALSGPRLPPSRPDRGANPGGSLPRISRLPSVGSRKMPSSSPGLHPEVASLP